MKNLKKKLSRFFPPLSIFYSSLNYFLITLLGLLKNNQSREVGANEKKKL